MVPVSMNWSAVLSCIIGTTLMSSSANALNQYFEAPYDAQMKRTQSRVLVIHRYFFFFSKINIPNKLNFRLSPLDAILFAGGTALAGGAILYHGESFGIFVLFL